MKVWEILLKSIEEKKMSRNSNYPWKSFSNKRQSQTKVRYVRPVRKSDLKGVGRQLVITTDQFSLTLNGTQLNSIKNVLAQAGEVKVINDWKKEIV